MMKQSDTFEIKKPKPPYIRGLQKGAFVILVPAGFALDTGWDIASGIQGVARHAVYAAGHVAYAIRGVAGPVVNGIRDARAYAASGIRGVTQNAISEVRKDIQTWRQVVREAVFRKEDMNSRALKAGMATTVAVIFSGVAGTAMGGWYLVHHKGAIRPQTPVAQQTAVAAPEPILN